MRRDDDTGRTTVDPRDRPMDDMPVLPPAGPDSNVFSGEREAGTDADREAEDRARAEARSEDDAQLTEAGGRDDIAEGDLDEVSATADHERAEPEARTEDADVLASEPRGENEERADDELAARARTDDASGPDEFQPVDDDRPAPDEAMVDSTATAADVSVIDQPRDQTPVDDQPRDQTPVDDQAPVGDQSRVDTATPVDRATPVETPTTEATSEAMAPGDVELTPVRDLWPEDKMTGLRDRWKEIQLRFVDDPAAAARDADDLVGEAIDTLTMALGSQRSDLASWQQSNGTDDTERLRVAVQRYRDFLDKMLDL